jgi:hypothetical protein
MTGRLDFALSGSGCAVLPCSRRPRCTQLTSCRQKASAAPQSQSAARRWRQRRWSELLADLRRDKRSQALLQRVEGVVGVKTEDVADMLTVG